mmetsp:Transcript_7632/g.24405  ORF Transcript_7632/g.24405 Transcript_7632/m.24405 type:complete len:248 (-) Transcript_7632:614-1357(-)
MQVHHARVLVVLVDLIEALDRVCDVEGCGVAVRAVGPDDLRHAHHLRLALQARVRRQLGHRGGAHGRLLETLRHGERAARRRRLAGVRADLGANRAARAAPRRRRRGLRGGSGLGRGGHELRQRRGACWCARRESLDGVAAERRPRPRPRGGRGTAGRTGGGGVRLREEVERARGVCGRLVVMQEAREEVGRFWERLVAIVAELLLLLLLLLLWVAKVLVLGIRVVCGGREPGRVQSSRSPRVQGRI